MMNKKLKRWIFAFFIISGFFFLIFIINQAFLFSQNLYAFSPILSEIVFWFFTSFFVISLAIPLFIFLVLPKRSSPPPEKGANYEKYLQKIAKQLNKNKKLGTTEIKTLEDIELSVGVLDEMANQKIKKSAKKAFITTAIAQNGSMDALSTLGILNQLIWNITHLYLQRPTIKDYLYVYSNVFMTCFFASQMDEEAYLEQIEPALTNVVGSAITAIPGTALIVSSLIDGSTTAFLTLRAGIIAREYCRPLTKNEKKKVKRLAIKEAAKMLVVISREGTAIVTSKVIGGKVTEIKDKISDSYENLKDREHNFVENHKPNFSWFRKKGVD